MIGCGGSGAPTTGQVFAALDVAGSTHDVATIRFRVVRSTDDCSAMAAATETVSIAGAGQNDAGSVSVESLLRLPPGIYRLCVAPLDASGQPSAYCSAADTIVTVVAGGLAEVSLVSQCADMPSGIHGTVGLNDPPQITAAGILSGTRRTRAARRR